MSMKHFNKLKSEIKNIWIVPLHLFSQSEGGTNQKKRKKKKKSFDIDPLHHFTVAHTTWLS